MEVLESLLLIGDKEELERYFQDNLQPLFDVLFLSPYELAKEVSPRVNTFYSINSRIFQELDFTQSNNTASVLMLADYLQRFDYSTSFQSLIRLCEKNGIVIGGRLQAASTFLSRDIKYNSDFLSAYESIIRLLDTAYKEEEDDEIKISCTLINYFHKVVNDTYQYDIEVAIKLQNLLRESRRSKIYYFLNDPVYDYLINLDLRNYNEDLSLSIQELVTSSYKKASLKIVTDEDFIIEEGTEYSQKLVDIDISFNCLYNYSFEYVEECLDDESTIRNSLGRGTKLLSEETQLFLYLKDFGQMHRAKLDNAFSYLLPYLNEDNLNLDVIDYGCGQGLGTIVLMDFLNSESKKVCLGHLILIEPSEICLRRASLHASKFSFKKIRTMQRRLEELNGLNCYNSSIKVHIFSNILDVEGFSISTLANRILASYKGVNYFVCVSPLINSIRTSRLDTFVKCFQNIEGFELIASVNSYRGQWHPRWTMVVRVFKIGF